MFRVIMEQVMKRITDINTVPWHYDNVINTLRAVIRDIEGCCDLHLINAAEKDQLIRIVNNEIQVREQK